MYQEGGERLQLTRIKFPVLKSLRIERYQLFPGRRKEGVDHSFLPGITVIAGINGLGKTTLLNVMLRCLTGPREPSKFDPYKPVGGVHKMRSKHVDYFAQRVLDEAEEATVDAEFYFGSQLIRIRRSLHDLRILGLWRDGSEVDGDEGALRKAIVRLSGAGDEYDFFYIVRSFTFFLEDKVSLIWNPQGQFEIFRILFLGPKQARKLAQLADEIKQIDSDYRNRRVQLNKDRKRLEQATLSSRGLSELQKALREAQIKADELYSRFEKHQVKLQQSLARRAELAEKTEKIHLEVEEATRGYQSLVETFFATAFPSLSATTQLILNNLTSGAGCLVCDNSNPQYPKVFLERASKGHCPFCGDDTTARQAPKMNARKRKELLDLETRLSDLQKSRRVLESALMKTEEEVAKLYKEHSHLSSEYLKKKNTLEATRAKLPPSEEERDKQLAEINRRQAELDALRIDRNSKTKNYAEMLKEARRAVEELKKPLTEKFSYYAGEFLAERCTLSWEPAKRRLGQEGQQLSFPQFTVEMTSALSHATGSPRKNEDQVSESQKEFIDLAFRMALFDTVRGEGERAMLAIETPEASLDAVFVDHAGRLLRRFALQDKNARNVVIATTNLNRENMLRSLLGLDEPGDERGKLEISQRVINLLTEAAPNAAMRKYGAEYEKQFNDAIELRK